MVMLHRENVSQRQKILLYLPNFCLLNCSMKHPSSLKISLQFVNTNKDVPQYHDMFRVDLGTIQMERLYNLSISFNMRNTEIWWCRAQCASVSTQSSSSDALFDKEH